MNELREYVKRKFNLTDDQYRQLVGQEKERIANPVFDYTGLTLEEAKQQKVKEIKHIASNKINAIAPVWKQLNVIRETGETATIFTDIDAIRTKSDDLEVKVTNATKVSEVEAIVWT